MSVLLLKWGHRVEVKGDADELAERLNAKRTEYVHGGANRPTPVAGGGVTVNETWWANRPHTLERFEALGSRLPVYVDPLAVVGIEP